MVAGMKKEKSTRFYVSPTERCYTIYPPFLLKKLKPVSYQNFRSNNLQEIQVWRNMLACMRIQSIKFKLQGNLQTKPY